MRAIALFSGGLDSMLAVKVIKEQGVDVTAIFIDVGFGSRDDKSELLKQRAEMVGADFEIINAREDFVQEILFNPRYGYGKNFNPCIDCHGNMVKIAKALLPKYGASFIITGEVVGQRPMSQRVEALHNVSRLANDREDKLLLRPLSAKFLEPTTPELNGWIDRDKLLGLSGRGREIQLEMAKKYNFTEFEAPGGGCLLTDKMFSLKMRESITHKKFTTDDIDLLKAGRHFRLPDGAKLIVGRDQKDNDRIENLTHPDFMRINLTDIVGPLNLINRSATDEDLKLACGIILTYTKAKSDENHKLEIENKIIESSPFNSKSEVKKYLVTIAK